MSIYSIPAMSLGGQFPDLDFLAKYVDQLMLSTGDRDYGVVYEWGPHGPSDYPPLAVLYRVDGNWIRRDVLVTIHRLPNGRCEYSWTVEGDVNGR